MRTTLILSISLASAVASAEPARTVCYTGAQTARVGTVEQTTHAVTERTYDPDKNEIRQRSWTDKTPGKEVAMTARVDPKAGTFEFDDPELAAHGTGKLDGKPWHWTGMSMTLTKGDVVISSTTKLTDTTLHQEATMTNKGKPVGTVTGELTAFDCKQLGDKKAALAKPAAK